MRSHLTPSQRAMLGEDIRPLVEEEANNKRLSTLKQNQTTEFAKLRKREPTEKIHTDEIIGKKLHVGTRSVSEAHSIAQKAPELKEHVLSGQIINPEYKSKISEDHRSGSIDYLIGILVSPSLHEFSCACDITIFERCISVIMDISHDRMPDVLCYVSLSVGVGSNEPYDIGFSE